MAATFKQLPFVSDATASQQDDIITELQGIEANQLPDGHNVTVDNTSGVNAVNIQDGGNIISVDYGDTASIDAFARLRVSEPETLFDSKQIFDNQPLFWDDQEVAGSGTSSTYNQNEAASTLAVSSVTAGRRIRQTFQRTNYQPGKSQLVLMTGVLGAGGTGIKTSLGQYDDNNGLFFLVDQGVFKVVTRSFVTGVAVDTEIAQSSFNIDTLDGTGPSGITLNLDNANIFIMDFEWLGVGRVRMGIVIDGLVYYCHQFLNANNLTDVYMSTPNLPLRYEIENLGTGAAAEMKHICTTVISEGGQNPRGVLRHTSNAEIGINANDVGIIYALVGLRLKSTAIGGVVDVLDATVIATTADDFEWLIVLNPTLANAITFTPQTNSVLESGVGNAGNPSNSTVTGGTVLAGGYSKSSNTISAQINNALRLGASIAGVSDEIYLCVRPLTSNLDVFGSITWRELA